MMKTAACTLIAVAGLVAGGAAQAQGALAEQLWSENFCQEAVSVAKQHGESPEILNGIDCQMLHDYPPSYWECVVKSLKADTTLKLADARQSCMSSQ